MDWNLVISGLVGLGGAGVGAAAITRASSVDRDAVRRRELDRVLTNLVAVAALTVGEFSRMPPARGVPLIKLWPSNTLDFVPGVRERRFLKTAKRVREHLGDRPRDLGDALAHALAELEVVGLREELKAPLYKSADYLVELVESRSEEAKERWPGERLKLLLMVARVRAHPRPLLDVAERVRELSDAVERGVRK